MATFKVKYATRNKLARALQMEIKKLGLVADWAMYDSVRISAMQSDNFNNITITVNPSNPTVLSSATIAGKVTLSHGTATVRILIRGVNGSIILNATVETDVNGYYEYVWQSLDVGTHRIRASWEGDDYAQPAESQTLAVEVKAKPETPLWQYAAVGAAIAIVVLAVVFSKRRKRRR